MEAFTIGFGTSDITPPVGVELAGFGWYIGRKSTGVIEPLYAKAMLWQSGGDRGALISCDIIGVSRQTVKEVRETVSAECGIPFDNIIICATHTHSGPATYKLIGWGEMDPDYVKSLPRKIADSAKTAQGAMAPACLEYGETLVSGISYNREYKDGPTDDRLRLLKVTHGGKMAGFLANYSCHPVVMCEETSLISGDFVGLAVNKAGKAHGCTGLFIQGAIGDQNSVFCHKPQDESVENLKTLSGRFADFIEKAIGIASPIAPAPGEAQAKAGRKEISLPQSPISKPMIMRAYLILDEALKQGAALPERLGLHLKFEKAVYEAMWERSGALPADARETEIQAVRFGDFTIVAHPSELFLRYQQDVVAALAPCKIMVAGCANDSVGYMPTPDKYDMSGAKLDGGGISYPAYFVPMMIGEFPFTENAGKMLVDEMVNLVRSLQNPLTSA